jgi:hypothetical protein
MLLHASSLHPLTGMCWLFVPAVSYAFNCTGAMHMVMALCEHRLLAQFMQRLAANLPTAVFGTTDTPCETAFCLPRSHFSSPARAARCPTTAVSAWLRMSHATRSCAPCWWPWLRCDKAFPDYNQNHKELSFIQLKTVQLH